MGTSSITITALTATPTLRGNKLKATVLATGPAANLPNLTLKTVVFYSSTTNDYTTATEIARGNPEALDAGLVEEQTYYYWAFAVDNSDNVGAVFPVSPTAGVACTAIGMSGLAFGLANGKLAVTHNSPVANALTIAVKTIAGNDPSVADPVFLAFPSVVSGSGGYSIRQIIAPLSLTISSGSTLGVGGLIPMRVWVVIFDDAGTLRLGVLTCSNGTGVIYPLPAFGVASSTAEGGAGGADFTGFIYTNVAVTSKPFRILAFAEWSSGLATQGLWASAPDNPVKLFGPSSPRPGDVVQDTGVPSAVTDSGTTQIPLDNTIPQSNEGIGTFFGVQITPTSPINLFDFDVVFNVSCSVASPIIGAMFRDAAASAFACCWCFVSAADMTAQLVFRHRVQAVDAAQRTYNYRLGASNAGTVRINSTSAGLLLGGTLYNYHGVKELMG